METMSPTMSPTISELVYPELKTTHRLNFGSTNFPIWKRKLDFVLVDNCVDYVLNHPKPPEPAADSPQEATDRHEKWLADDFTCRHLILGSLDETLFLMFVDQPTAKSLVYALASHFRPTLSLRVSLFRRYVNHRMAEDCPIGRHIADMGAEATELEMAGVKVPDEMRAVVLIESLPESWKDVVDALLVRLDLESDLSLRTVTQRMRFSGEMKALFRQRDEGTSNGGFKEKFSKGDCYVCDESSSDCPVSEIFLEKAISFRLTVKSLRNCAVSHVTDANICFLEGGLKRVVLEHETGLEPKEQSLSFGGKERNDEEFSPVVGVEDMSKVVLMEDPAASKESTIDEMKINQYAYEGYESVAEVRAEVDKLSNKVVYLGRAVRNGIRVAEKEFTALSELLMVQLLKLDSTEADGEAKIQRRIEVHRVQSFVDALDNLKTINSNRFGNNGNIASGTINRETFSAP